MAPRTRAQMKQLAEDALRAVQEWLTAIPREILKKLSPDSLSFLRAAAKSLVASTEVHYRQVRPDKQGKPRDSERKTSRCHKSI